MLPKGMVVRAVITDVDGCLTDGKIHRISDGATMRSFHTHDGIGHKLLVQAGIKVAWLSATSERESILGRAQMVGLDPTLVDTGEGEKGARFEALCAAMGVSPGEAVFMGDDVNDLPAMRKAGLAVCPANARPEVRAAASIVLQARGGEGAFRELAEMVLAAGGRAQEGG